MKRLSGLVGACLLLSVTGAAAQNSLVGTWQGSVVFNGMTVGLNLVMMPNGKFSEQQTMSGMMTMDTGTYTVLPNNQLHFTVEDWEPKQQCFPQSGCHDILKPPGGLYNVRFISGSTMQVQDVNNQGIVVYQRVQ